MKDKFDIPQDIVTIDNALRFILAIEQAVYRDLNKLGKSNKALAASIVGAALDNASHSIMTKVDSMVKNGEAEPLSEEQLLHLKLLFRRAHEDKEN